MLGAASGATGVVGLKLVAPDGIGLSLVLSRGAATAVLVVAPPVVVAAFAAGTF